MKFGLIGTGIQASGSPALFRAAYGGRWDYDLLDGTEFLPLWERFLEEYQAVNVTAPFKQDAFAQAVQLAKDGYAGISGPCFKIRATNLAVKTPEGLMFHNSDFTGVMLSIAEACFPGVVEQCYAVYGERGHIKVHQFLKEQLGSAYGYKPQALVVGCSGGRSGGRICHGADEPDAHEGGGPGSRNAGIRLPGRADERFQSGVQGM